MRVHEIIAVRMELRKEIIIEELVASIALIAI